MDKEILQKCFENLLEAYKKSNLIIYATPDQFQYRQNCLLQAMAEFMIANFSEYLKKNDAQGIEE